MSRKITFVSNYCEEYCLAQPASTFLNQHPMVPIAMVENEVSGLAIEPLSEEETDLFMVEVPEHLELVAEVIPEPYQVKLMCSMDKKWSLHYHCCTVPMYTS